MDLQCETLAVDAGVVAAQGYMNGDGGRRIAGRVHELLDSGCERVLVDLEGTRLVNHNGLDELRTLCEEVARRGGWICFCNLTTTVNKAFRIAGLVEA